MAKSRAILLALALASCGGPSFDGVFKGSYQGQETVLALRQDGKTLSGTITWGGYDASVSGSVEGDRVTGTVRQPQLGIELPFEATLKDDTLDWTYRIEDGMTGQTQRLALTFTRGGGEPSGSGEARGGIDPRLVGRWYSDVGGTGASGNTVTTRIRCALNADGSFEYGGAESVITLRENFYGPGNPGGAGPAGVVRGQWKAEGGILFSRTDGATWVPLGRYSVSGSDLLVYGADGGKNLWSRE
jgi:hypothetical protein